MASGVAVDDACKTAFQELKLGHQHRYIVFRLTEDLKQIVVEKKADPGMTYDDCVADLKEAEAQKQCRYVTIDFPYEGADGQARNKICFIMWNPEGSSIKQRMVYSSSKDALKRALGEGIGKEIQANDHGDLAASNIIEKIRQTERT